MILASSLRKCGCHSSRPGELLESRARSFPLTISDVISIVDKTSTSWMESIAGIFSRFSEVKTLAMD